ncbi:MAG TPA: hypothetical protein VIJ26_00545 [Thermoanaerobaculia bacterium]
MKKRTRRLTLSRETILRLNDSSLRGGVAALVATGQDTDQPACYSPYCGPTYWRTCDPCEITA